MRLPKDILTGTMTKPRLFLCETNKTKICQLETLDMNASLKFNAYSELTFTIGRTYTNMINGETQVNPFYNKIEALRLVYLEGFGYFEIQDPEIVTDGIKEVKNVTAHGLEYTLSQKYLEEFYVNTGENNSIEVMYANEHNLPLSSVSLYNPENRGLSLLHLALEKIYGWSIGHVDPSLREMTRTFEVSRASVYDFIVQDICEKFNCFAVFDTIENTINIYAEALITKNIGDGTTTSFLISPPYKSIGSVTVNGYRTTAYQYNSATGELVFDYAPSKNAKIEIADGAQQQWITDVYVTFDNLAQECNVSYSADDIKTVLTVKGADDLGIHEVNMGLPYIVDLSYYYDVDWMGQELYDAYTNYLKKNNEYKNQYSINAEQILVLQNDLTFEENRVSLGYGVDSSVNTETVGTYYIIDGGSYPNYTYREVSLPSEYNANFTYYKLNGVNVTENKVHTLYSAIRKFFIDMHNQEEPEDEDVATRDGTWEELLVDLTDQFKFVSAEFGVLKAALTSTATVDSVTAAFRTFLDIIWIELGRTPLQQLFLKPYESVELANKEAGYDNISSSNYWFYYPVTIMLDSLNDEISRREPIIDDINNNIQLKSNENFAITEDISIYNNFTHSQLIRLSAFLREDEYTDDNFVETDAYSIEELMDLKQELLECGRIELSKLCEPKLEFSMDMANIYALPEFEPIIDQFQLGNLITVAIRDDYIKRARLLAVNINFDDFSDFSCDFGELTNLRTPSSIHADLLANALTAGKSVASNASYWNKGADTATDLSLLIQQGLLDAVTAIKATDGSQGVSIDRTGIHLQRIDPNTGEVDPKEGWIINNQFLYSDDNFRTSKSVFGEYYVDGETKWGLLAEAVMAGYIAGCTVEGGVIRIGLQSDGTYAFEVRSDGSVIMNGGTSIAGYAKESDLNEVKDALTITSDIQPENAHDGQLWLDTSKNPYVLMVYTNAQWVRFSQQDDQKVYTSKPLEYTEGDLWILAVGEIYPEDNPIYGYGNILKADEDLNWTDATPYITNVISNIEQYFEFNKNNGLKIGQKDDEFYVNISSTRMSFYDKSDGSNTTERPRDPDEVVYISNKSAVMKKIIVEEDAMFESPASFEKEINMYQPDTTSGFSFKIESNGSFSLVVSS